MISLVLNRVSLRMLKNPSRNFQLKEYRFRALERGPSERELDAIRIVEAVGMDKLRE